MGEADFLRQTVISACIEINTAASLELPVAPVSALTLRLSSETEGLFDNVASMIQLLTMSINRTQDFIKISSDIPLVPDLGTLDLVDVLEMVDKCMASQNSDRIVNIHPLVRTASKAASKRNSNDATFHRDAHSFLHSFSSDHCLPATFHLLPYIFYCC